MSDKAFDERFAKLNEQQKKAVSTIDGPVLVVAGPGSGKTELLSMRVANILKCTDAPASSILCLTFTEAAASNMRTRLSKIIGHQSHEVAIHTFHSFGREVISQYPEYFYKGAIFNPVDDILRAQIFENIFTGLKHDNPLKSSHPTQGFTYFRSVGQKISDLKRGGISPENFRSILNENMEFLQVANCLVSDFYAPIARVSKKHIELFASLISSLESVSCGNCGADLGFESMKDSVVGALKEAFAHASATEKTNALSEWKKKYLMKDQKNDFVFKDFTNLDKHIALADIYDQYQSILHKDGLFDFDDMLLDVINAMEKHPELKYNLQERYLYFLVDEFQDTSGVQMKLLTNLLDAEVNEERPNVLVVGDDDQSIYKFQGANLGNILDFHEKYKDPEIVVLTKNYRSTQPILDLIRKLIIKGGERLENRIDGFTKELSSENSLIENGEILEYSFDTHLHEMTFIAKRVKELIDDGHDPGEIALISRKHAHLEAMSSVLQSFGVGVNYEKNKNVFEQPHVKMLLLSLKFLSSFNKKDVYISDHLLPEIVSAEYWKISRIDIWKVSLLANKNKSSWIEVMLEYENESVQNVAKFFVALAAESLSMTAEQILDTLMGSVSIDCDGTEIKSPFKEHYFSEDKLREDSKEYLELLSNLTVFVKAIRTYKGSKALSLDEVVEFIELHEKYNIVLNDSGNFSKDDKAVNLMTAHGSKGLEFKTVFAFHCVDDIWSGKGGYNNLSLPSNLPLEAEKDYSDDFLRIFYVALSRAKQNLYITHHKTNENGKNSLKMRFLNDDVGLDEQSLSIDEESLKNAFETNIFDRRARSLTSLEAELLKTRFVNYKLSVTSLNKFLDLVYGGPDEFLLTSILRFPEMKSVEGAYGSAMHKALENFYKVFKTERALPSVDVLLNLYEEALSYERLSKRDFEDRLDRGKSRLSLFYERNKDVFDPNDKVEVRFDNQGVAIDDALLSGNIDIMKVDEENREIFVMDYKTGNPINERRGLSANDHVKMWKNKQQVIFYKLLVENSRDYKKYEVRAGQIRFLDADKDDQDYMDVDIYPEDVERMKKLIKVVYKKITSLDFPDVSGYEKNMMGINHFIDDLIEGRC